MIGPGSKSREMNFFFFGNTFCFIAQSGWFFIDDCAFVRESLMGVVIYFTEWVMRNCFLFEGIR